jgi:hypothetical protein
MFMRRRQDIGACQSDNFSASRTPLASRTLMLSSKRPISM